MNRRTSFILLVALAAWLSCRWFVQASEPHFHDAVVYDATVEREVPFLPRIIDCQHLWQLDSAGNLPRTVHWDKAFAAAAKGEDLTLGIEPDINEQWPHRTDPSVAAKGSPSKLAPLEQVRQTHRILAQQLEPLCMAAKATGAKVWTYRLLSPTLGRGEHIVNKHQAWQKDVKSIVHLEYAPGKTIAKLLAETGGGELVEAYVPPQWNTDHPISQLKCSLLIERQQSTLEALDVNSMPVMHPFTHPGRQPLNADIWRQMIFTAKGRSRVVIWNGPYEDDKGRAWFPKMPAWHKEALK